MKTHSPLFVLLSLLMLLSCGETVSGTVSLAATWDQQPDGPVWLLLKVEERGDPLLPGQILSSAGPTEYIPGEPLELAMAQVPNGENRVVIVEVREGTSTALPVLYYGISGAFSMASGKHVQVEVPLVVQRPEAESGDHPPVVELVFGGEVREQVGKALVSNATVRTRSVGAVELVLANDGSFVAANTRFLVGESGSGISCTAEVVDEVTWDVCEISNWDMTAELPDIKDGLLWVFVKFVDRYGYESSPYKRSVEYDQTAPQILRSTLSPSVAKAGDIVTLSVTMHETVALADGAILTVLPDGPGKPAFDGPVQVADSNTYVWTANISALGEGSDIEYGFGLWSTDPLGNSDGAAVTLLGQEGDQLILRLDAGAPELAWADSIELSKSLYGLGEGAEESQQTLSFLFALKEDNPGGAAVLGQDMPCTDDCPQVRLAGKEVGTVFRHVELDRSSTGEYGFGFEYVVTAADWPAIDQEIAINIIWNDLAGNSMDVSLTNELRFDFVRPEALDCRLLPEIANLDSTLEYMVSASEPLQAPPQLNLSDEAETLFGSPPVISGGGNIYTWHEEASAVPGVSLSLTATLEDLAGNSSSGVVCPETVILDVEPPVLSGGAVGTWPEAVDQAGEVVLAVGDQGLVAASFTASDNKGLADGYPQVFLDVPGKPLEMFLVTKTDEDGGAFYEFEVLLDAAANSGEEGNWPVRVVLADEAGNEVLVSKLANQWIAVDFTPPSADCTLIPALPDAGYGIGTKISLQVSPFEGLKQGVEPLVEELFEPALAGPLLGFEPGTTFRFTGEVHDTGANHAFSIRVTLVDVVGNETPSGETACTAGVVLGKVDAAAPWLAGASLTTGAPDFLDEPTEVYPLHTPMGVALEIVGTELRPQVFLGTGEMAAAGETPDSVLDGVASWWFQRTLDGSEGEGKNHVIVSGIDEAGNPYDFDVVDEWAEFDFTPPAATCIAGPELAGLGKEVSLTVMCSEELQGNSPDLTATVIPLGEPVVSNGGLQFVYKHTVEEGDYGLGEPPTSWSYEVKLTDKAGNTSTGENACVGTGQIDNVPPDIAGGKEGVYVSQSHLKDGDKLVVGFSLAGGEMLPEEHSPAVQLGDEQLGPTDDSYEADYLYGHIADKDTDSPGMQPLFITLNDPAGNLAFFALDPVTNDFGPPELVGSPIVSISAPEGCQANAASGLTHGSRLNVSITVDDVLAEPPQVSMSGESGTYEMVNVDEPNPFRTTFNYRFEVGVDGEFNEGPIGLEDALGLSAQLEDLAGNKATVSLGQEVLVDTVPPAVPDVVTPGRIVYTRVPWGYEGSDGVKAFYLRGEPGAVEPGSEIMVYSEVEPHISVELVRTTASDEGAFGEGAEGGDPLLVGKADQEELYVTVVDGACNSSDADIETPGVQGVLVRDVEWVGTFGAKVPGSTGENPNVLENRSWFTGRHDQPDVVEPDDTANLAASSLPEVSLRGSGDWLERGPQTSVPQTRTDYGMAFDEGRNRLVMYGGHNPYGILDETWEWSDSGWEKMVPTDPEGDGDPPALKQVELVYDPVREKVVLFGGTVADVFDTSPDVWEWDGMSWRKVEILDPESDGGPPGLFWHALAFDKANGAIVQASGQHYPDIQTKTWNWDGSSWKLAGYLPLKLDSCQLAYDEVREVTVLALGRLASGSDMNRDVYEWDGSEWLKQTVVDNLGDGSPDGCCQYSSSQPEKCTAQCFPAMAWCPHLGRVAIPLPDGGFWAWNGDGEWELVPAAQPAAAPTATSWVYAPAADKMVALEGVGSSSPFEVWQWDGTTWELWQVPSDLAPNPAKDHTAQYDSLHGHMVIGRSSSMSGLWTWDGREWGQLPNSHGGPTEYYLPGSFWDHDAGGLSIATMENEISGIWVYQNGGWGFVGEADEVIDNDVGFEIYLRESDAVQNPEDLTVLRFGGLACRVFEGEEDYTCRTSSQTFRWDGVDWELLDVPDPEGDGNPAGRYAGALAWDPVRENIQLVSGNCNYGGYKPGPGQNGPFENLQWEWDGTSWAKVEYLDPEGDGSAGNPEDGWDYVQYRLATDFERKRIFAVSHGGETAKEALWQWNGVSWLMPAPADPTGDGRPYSRIDTAVAYDSARDRLMMYGGRKPTSGNTNDLWEWNPGTLERPAQVARFSGAAAGYGDNEKLEELSLVWVAGGQGYLDEEAVGGLILYVWDRGYWRKLTELADALPDAPGTIIWSTTDTTLLQRLPSGAQKTISFAVATAHVNGRDYARVVSDYIELRLRYRK